MYKANIVTTDNLKIVNFTQAITLSEKIPQFIHDIDEDKDSWSVLTKFEKWYPTDSSGMKDESICYGLEKTAIPYSQGSGNLNIDRKSFYIIDSILAGLEFCSDLYQNFTHIEPIEWPKTFSIRRWDSGGSMGPHHDTYTGKRDYGVSAVAYLNDNYEGGELYFPEYKVKVKPTAGSIIFFPSNTIHEALEVKSGHKYFAPFFSL